MSNRCTEVRSNNMSDLLPSLKAAKEETNAVLTKLVESSKETKQARKDEEEEEDSSSEDDDDSARKKQKS